MSLKKLLLLLIYLQFIDGYAHVTLWGNSGALAAISDFIAINNDSATFAMYTSPSLDEPYTNKGNWSVLLVIGNNSRSSLYWHGVVEQLNISDEITTISFNSFIEFPVSSSISQSEQSWIR
jgi:hypothetical protein